jgi:hypothetical protein
MKPQAAHILAVLRDGNPHGAVEFKRGMHGVYVDAVSQRVSELNALGYAIESTGRGGRGLAAYRLISEPTAYREEVVNGVRQLAIAV